MHLRKVAMWRSIHLIVFLTKSRIIAMSLPLVDIKGYENNYIIGNLLFDTVFHEFLRVK